MGTKFSAQCLNPSTQAISKLDSLTPLQQPQPSYAYPEHIKFEVPCCCNHILTDMDPPLLSDQALERGKHLEQSYFVVPFGVYYTGEWKQGRPHGVGEVVFRNGSILKGTFVAGQLRGSDCVMVMEDGSYYRGNMENSCFTGRGRFVQENGHFYEGDWANNMPHGRGYEHFSNGDTYEGFYHEGAKNDSNGVYKWHNHPEFAQYTGQFWYNYMKGKGVLTKKNGTQITGTFDDGSVQDALVQSKQYEYRGSVKEGKLDGYGRIIYKTTKVEYEGYFRQGQPHGEGSLKMPNGQTKKGYFFQGTYIEQMKGLSEDEISGCLRLVETQLSNAQYAEDLIDDLNESLRQSGYPSYKASLLEATPNNKIFGSKFILVSVGSLNLLVSQQK